jgi:hypothetical protein
MYQGRTMSVPLPLTTKHLHQLELDLITNYNGTNITTSTWQSKRKKTNDQKDPKQKFEP